MTTETTDPPGRIHNFNLPGGNQPGFLDESETWLSAHSGLVALAIVLIVIAIATTLTLRGQDKAKH
jgi:hypothetical protein